MARPAKDWRHGGGFALGLFSGIMISLLVFLLFSAGENDFLKSSEFLSALCGGLLAGILAIAATILANAHEARLANESRRESDGAIASTIYSKLHEARDSIVKGYRHHFDGSPSNFIAYGTFGQLPKPLAFSQIDRLLTDSEIAFVFQQKNAQLFNDVLDADRAMRLFNSLTSYYEKCFKEFENHVSANNRLNVKGAHVSGEVVIDPMELLKIEDARNVLKSFLLRASADFPRTHQRFIDFLKSDFGISVDYIVVEEITAAAPNHYEGFHGGR